MHKEYLTPWARLFDDNVERISRVSYYGGSLKVYLLTDTFRKSYEKFLEKCDQSKVKIHSTSYDTTFVDCELSPDIDNEDKIAFEEKFHVKILFFQKTRKDRQAHSEGNRGSRYRNQESLDGTEKLFSIYGDDPTKMRHGHNNAQVKGLFAPTAPRSMGVVNASAEPRNAQIVDNLKAYMFWASDVDNQKRLINTEWYGRKSVKNVIENNPDITENMEALSRTQEFQYPNKRGRTEHDSCQLDKGAYDDPIEGNAAYLQQIINEQQAFCDGCFADIVKKGKRR
ncbi:hypothetical protein ACOME3_002837 [Neoechinorhynchus agilis]